MPSKSKPATSTHSKKKHSTSSHSDSNEEVVEVDVPSVQRSKVEKGTTSRSISSRCGLILPVNRINEKMKKLMKNYRHASTASIYLTGAIEELIVVLLSEVSKIVGEHHKSRITPALILSTVQQNDQLASLFFNTVFFGVGYNDGGYDSRFWEEREEAKKKKKGNNKKKPTKKKAPHKHNNVRGAVDLIEATE